MAKSERKKKWLEKRPQQHTRVTRASTSVEKPVQASKSTNASKLSTSEAINSKSKTSPSSQTTASKDKNNKTTAQSAITPVKKHKYEPPEPVNNANDSVNDGPTAKKKKFQYVDAVEKLENSTSVHVPKKLVLFVGNLSEDVTKEQIQEHFKRTGGVKSIRIPKYKGTDTGKGFAYVEFKSTISHRLGVRLHNTTMGDRKIVVEFAAEGKMTEKKVNELLQSKESHEEAPLKMPFDT